MRILGVNPTLLHFIRISICDIKLICFQIGEPPVKFPLESFHRDAYGRAEAVIEKKNEENHRQWLDKRVIEWIKTVLWTKMMWKTVFKTKKKKEKEKNANEKLKVHSFNEKLLIYMNY